MPLWLAEVSRNDPRARDHEKLSDLPVVTPALRALLEGLVDYAGLFPPAALSMSEAVTAYASYVQGPHDAMLGRFIVPVSRVDEFAAESARFAASATHPWRVSAIIDEKIETAAPKVRRFNHAHVGRLSIDATELRAQTTQLVETFTASFPEQQRFVEVSLEENPLPMLEAISARGTHAKVRTGGVTEDAFPSSIQLAGFIFHSAALRLPFKATAGLHHPMRGRYPLTYAPDAPRAMMFGFLNVFIAAAIAWSGADESLISRALEEQDPLAFRFSDEAVEWESHRVPVSSLHVVRREFALSFGSCSFDEPVADLREIGLL